MNRKIVFIVLITLLGLAATLVAQSHNRPAENPADELSYSQNTPSQIPVERNPMLQTQQRSTRTDTLTASLNSMNTQNFPFVFSNVNVSLPGEDTTILSQEDFSVYENGVLQNLFFEVTPPATGGGLRWADIVFVLDVSGSMAGTISAVKNNILSFINSLASSEIDYRIGLVTFGDIFYVYNNYNLYADHDQILSVVNNISLGEHGIGDGGDYPENQIGSMAEAAIFNFRPGAQRVIIMLTDATSHVGNHVTPWTVNTLINDRLLPNNITVFPVFNTYQYDQINQYVPIAEATNPNGTYFHIYDNFNSIILEIGALVANTYVIRYRTSNPSFDGTVRNVEYRVNYNGQQASAFGSYQPGSAPQISRTQATIDLHDNAWPELTTFEISAQITDLFEPFTTGARLYFKHSEAAAYTFVNMTNPDRNNIWYATIPASAAMAPGVDYYITATDGQSTSTSPAVDPSTNPYQLAIMPNIAPVIIHVPVQNVNIYSDVTIGASISDTTDYLSDVSLFYRSYGYLSYSRIDMIETGSGFYTAVIPGSIVANDGADYYIRATDNWGVSSYSGFADNPHHIATVMDGTVVPGGDLSNAVWNPEDSPYHVLSDVTVPEGESLSILPGVVVYFAGNTGIEVYGSFIANGALFTTDNTQVGWRGITFDTNGTVLIQNCIFEHAQNPVFAQNTDVEMRNVTITKDNSYPNEAGIDIIDSSAPILHNLLMGNYSKGIRFSNDATRITSTPVMSNVRVRNSTGALRPESIGLDIAGAVAIDISDAVFEEYDTGIHYEASGIDYTRTTPVITNVRVRNSTGAQRNINSGMILNGLQRIIVENDSIVGYPTGLQMTYSGEPRVNSTPVITNVRVRNSTGGQREESLGISLSGNIDAELTDVDIDDFNVGLMLANNDLSRISSTPVISNVRVRNSTGALRSESYGIKVIGQIETTMDELEIDNYLYGISYKIESDSTRISAAPVITNVRVRNSTGGLRTDSYGIKLEGALSAQMDNIEIADYTIGLDIRNEFLNNPITSTLELENIAVFKTIGAVDSLEAGAFGIKTLGSVIMSIDNAEIENYATGLCYTGDGIDLDRTTPLISNVRVRNSTGALRTEPVGIKLSNIPAIELNRNIVFVTNDENGVVLGRGIEILDNTNVEIENCTIYGYSTGLYAPDARSNVSLNISMIWASAPSGLIAPILGAVQATNSNISYSAGNWADGNYNLDPLFRGPSQGDFVLKYRTPFRYLDIGAIPYDLELLLETHVYTMHQGWNLMGVPYITRAGENTPVAIFADDLNPFYVSPYLTSIVQMNSISQVITPEQPYGRYALTHTGGYNIPSHVIPPMGYWVRNVHTTAVVDVVGAPDDGEYIITIPPAPGINNRWFLLANPYEVPIAWNGGIRADDDLIRAAYVYDATSSSYPMVHEDLLNTIPAWGGFFIRALEGGGNVYFDYPSGAAPSPNNAPRSASDIIVAQNSDQAWSFSIQAKHQDKAARIYLGAHPEASDEYDSLDLLALPDAPFVLSTPLRLSVPNNDWESSPGNYVRDTKALATNTWSWNAILDLSNWDMANDSDGSIYLNADEFMNIPPEYQISLINTLTGESVDPRTEYLSIRLRDLIAESPASDSRVSRSRFNRQIPLQIAVTGLGTQQQGSRAGIISAVNYPNPFNPQTVISYNLGSANSVSLDIYNIKGQKVKNLVNSTQEAGLHSVIWNGTDSSGNNVASGIYFYRLQAGKHSITKKVLLSK